MVYNMKHVFVLSYRVKVFCIKKVDDPYNIYKLLFVFRVSSCYSPAMHIWSYKKKSNFPS